MKNKVSNIFEVVLILIGITLVSVIVSINIDKKVIQENEYSYYAYKFEKTADSITVTFYSPTGNPPKTTETYHMKDGKIYKIVEEKYFKSVNNARFFYNDELKQIDSLGYDISIDKNVVTHTTNEPNIFEENEKNYPFTTNAQLIKYAEEHIADDYEGYTRVY